MARRFYLPSLPTILSRMAEIAGPIIPIYAQGQVEQEPEEVELEDEDEAGEAEALAILEENATDEDRNVAAGAQAWLNGF